jgi:hypothetical protein
MKDPVVERDAQARRNNHVARLKRQIALHQSECTHDNRLFALMDLRPSVVENEVLYFVGSREAPDKIAVGCMLCDLESTISPIEKCPQCLSPMKEVPGNDADYSKVCPDDTGSSAPYMALQKYECTSCKLRVVASYYDR